MELGQRSYTKKGGQEVRRRAKQAESLHQQALHQHPPSWSLTSLLSISAPRIHHRLLPQRRRPWTGIHFCCCCLVSKLGMTLCSPTGCSPLGFFAHRMTQARILLWVVIPFSRGSFQPRDWTQVSQVSALQGNSLPAELPGKPQKHIYIYMYTEYWSGLPCPSPGDLPGPGIEPASLASPALQGDSLPLCPLERPGIHYTYENLLAFGK